ncbi:MAG: 2-oxo acid dehydrogenase subunit E2 [Deltaproteobacteria bacterium]|nr:2-oxo acid dehydrogenase subunit E2 [Deltaproteobacteria bacterium]
MADKIVMPQLGESIAEGTIVKWLKSPGDAVKKDENVLLISTDKVEAEIPSPSAGVLLSIDVGAGETVPVGTVLGMVGESGEAVAPPKAAAENPVEKPAELPKSQSAPPVAPAPVPQSTPPVAFQVTAAPQGSRFLSPLVKKIAAEHQVPTQVLEQLPGSGRDSRLTKKDLLAHLANGIQNMSIAKASMPRRESGVVIPPGQSELIQPVSTMRRVIMENMIASRQQSAHVTTFFEVDYTQIDRVRAAHKERFKQEEGVALTYTTFLAAAISSTLKRHPYINAQIKDDEIIFKKDVHLGIAVAIEQPEPGLMVPVIRNSDQMNLRGLGRAIADIAVRVRSKKIKPDELSGGSFTITNPGNYGAVIGTPIINQPQVAILGVGQIKKQPVVLEHDSGDVIAIRNRGWLSLSFDHRLIDGATADIFMADLKQTLETWTAAP